MTLAPRPQDSAQCRLVLLAPPNLAPQVWLKSEISPGRYERLLRGMQRLRARTYLEDGAIHPSEISPDGCHRHPADPYAWHVLSLDCSGEVRGCSRYVAHSNAVTFSQLGIRK